MKDIRNLSKEEKIAIIEKEGDKEIFDLRESDLRESDLRESDLRGSDLRDAKIDETTFFSRIKITRKQVDIVLKQMFDIQEGEE